MRIREKPKIIFGFDARRSFVLDRQIKISGFRLGIDMGRVVRAGVGLYWLEQPVYFSKIVNEGTLAEDTLITQYNFGYFSWFAEYILWYTKRWEFTTTLNFGLGSNTIITHYANAGLPTQITEPLTILEPSFGITYNFLSWCGIGSGYGYRYILNRNSELRARLSDHIYFVKLKIYLGVIYRALFPKVAEEIGVPDITPD